MHVSGGELERGSLTHFTGYSEKAQCTGNTAYLEPNSNRMQKTYRGSIRNGVFRNQ